MFEVLVLIEKTIHKFKNKCIEEIKIFFNYNGARDKRIGEWRSHINVYASLDGGNSGKDAVTRMEFLAMHLRVLDVKFASLLTFLGLLATVASVLKIADNMKLLRLNFIASKALILFPILWALSVILCIWGSRMFFWGEGMKTSEDKLQQASIHVEGLIDSLVCRTAILRCTWWLTMATVVMFLVVGGFLTWYDFHGSKQASSHLVSVPIKNFPHFSSASAQEPYVVLREAVCSARLKFQSTGTSLAFVVGHHDRRELSNKTWLQYGYNSGLAQQRADFIGKLLKDATLQDCGPPVKEVITIASGPSNTNLLSFSTNSVRDNTYSEDRRVDIYGIQVLDTDSDKNK